MPERKTFPLAALLTLTTGKIIGNPSDAWAAATWVNDGRETGPVSLGDRRLARRIRDFITNQLGLPTAIDGVQRNSAATSEDVSAFLTQCESRFGAEVTLERDPPASAHVKERQSFSMLALLSVATGRAFTNDMDEISRAATWVNEGAPIAAFELRDPAVREPIAEKIARQTGLPTFIPNVTRENFPQIVSEMRARFGVLLEMTRDPAQPDVEMDYEAPALTV